MPLAQNHPSAMPLNSTPHWPAEMFVYRFCAWAGATAMLAAALWLGLAIFPAKVSSPRLHALLADPGPGRFLTALSILLLIVGALAFWSAGRCRRGRAEGRKILVTAVALFHCLAFIVTMVQFTWLPNVIRDLRPNADPFQNLVHRQHILLAASAAAWALLFMFDLWLGRAIQNTVAERISGQSEIRTLKKPQS